MHRGSSKAAREGLPAADTLPLSASSPSEVSVEIEVTRAGKVQHHLLHVATGTRVREAVRQVGLAPEGSVVLIDDTPVPLDLPLDRSVRLVVVPTFSGG
jgi:sulfur carrier protein ThiS